YRVIWRRQRKRSCPSLRRSEAVRAERGINQQVAAGKQHEIGEAVAAQIDILGLLVRKTCGRALEWPKGLPFIVFVTVIAGPRRRRDNQIEMAVGLKIKQCQIRAAEIALDGKLKRGALRVAAVTFRAPIDRRGGVALQE
ncbi:hypothetical protein CEE94_12905, partial [Lactobacillus crispatus]